MAKILIIDKDTMEAGIERAALEQHGHDVRVVSRSDAALQAVNEGWPDLVVLDPNHDVGVAAVDAARAGSDAHGRIPLLLVSNPHEGHSLGADELADDHLEHPFAAEALLEKVAGLLA